MSDDDLMSERQGLAIFSLMLDRAIAERDWAKQINNEEEVQ